MTYIIQGRLVRICYNGRNSESILSLLRKCRVVTDEGKANDRDFSEQLKEFLFPSIRQEHRQPITLIRL